MERIDYRELASSTAVILEEKKGEETVLLDVRQLTSFTDYILISTLNSQPQMKAVLKELSKQMNIIPSHVEGDTASGWVLVDLDGLIVNLFFKEVRDFYRLERLWGEALRVEYDV